MKYDFTSIIDRHNMDAIAVDGLGTSAMSPAKPKEGFDIIPMWVADMNFPTVPTIPEAIIERAKHPAYGYFSPREEYFQSIIDWQTKRNGVTGLEKDHIGYENGVQQVYLNGENITSQLREEAVGNMASVSSAVPAVRAKLLDLQRNLAKEKDVVMDGRDIGTNVLPNADVKVYLTASVECRAMRRFKELEGKGEACDFEQIRQDIQERDERDMTREIAPLKQAEDATLIDSSEMGIDDVVKAIIALTK